VFAPSLSISIPVGAPYCFGSPTVNELGQGVTLGVATVLSYDLAKLASRQRFAMRLAAWAI
jgi:hypothetical protein